MKALFNTRQTGAVFLSLLLAACSSLPSSGPNYKAVQSLAGNEQKLPDVNVIKLDAQNVEPLYQHQQNQRLSGFSLLGSSRGHANTVNIGDVLEISIWEAPPAVLFGGTFNGDGTGSGHLTKLPEQMVNQNGRVTVPFIGEITVAGKTPEAIQTQIVSALARKANQPQALVRMTTNNSADVTVIRQGSSIRMPLTVNNERVLDAISAVGGSPADIQDITVQLTRDNQVKTVAFETLIADPAQNITLRNGDVVTLLTTPYSFTGLGAIGNNQQMKFSTKGLTLAEAIGRMGGLIDNRADARGVFIFRHIPFDSLDPLNQSLWLRKGYGAHSEIPTVYNVNLQEPQSMFLLQRFPIQDKDIVYVSNAPLAEFQKFLRMIFSITSPITSTATSIQSF